MSAELCPEPAARGVAERIALGVEYQGSGY